MHKRAPYSRKSRSKSRRQSRKQDNKHSHAHSNMSLTTLQNMAKSKGIPFGGLNKSSLVRKINRYVY